MLVASASGHSRIRLLKNVERKVPTLMLPHKSNTFVSILWSLFPSRRPQSPTLWPPPPFSVIYVVKWSQYLCINIVLPTEGYFKSYTVYVGNKRKWWLSRNTTTGRFMGRLSSGTREMEIRINLNLNETRIHCCSSAAESAISYCAAIPRCGRRLNEMAIDHLIFKTPRKHPLPKKSNPLRRNWK